MALHYQMAVGLNKGREVTVNVGKPRRSRRRGRLSKHTTFMRDVIWEVCGFTTYEHQAMELLKSPRTRGPSSSSSKGWGHTSAPRGRERSLATSWLPGGKGQPGRTEPFPSVHNKLFQKKKKKKHIITSKHTTAHTTCFVRLITS